MIPLDAHKVGGRSALPRQDTDAHIPPTPNYANWFLPSQAILAHETAFLPGQEGSTHFTLEEDCHRQPHPFHRIRVDNPQLVA
jgi:hypothetical protein